ncbi:efflux RND transporter periplasmic adaptor subunit [Stutzerimonas stutzeri]|uniref:efflux RND transporter periplasmic adaptor subunit n=1 Tax=Stutzerimonas stutzeri TaxID=316 RepID=UPI0012C1FC92|nr:HlyD family efflux transporter periplasmic adaptor subunit [Stutzerimonas stutzeri]MBH3353087.1 HlyD family efflux transporter periplasmic adaptor subunit [Stutzerimonas stutzeri]MCJ0877128.1 HlyD family efflux transporter periplasmic adaptor subunit [Pseudomonas sp. JI-2]MPS56686.1 HlyD family efflux transporter periplasmic adaptor subunit [Pseudomonas sp.]WQN28984.1 HlyD family efflux transporter periplasmic adaptor subunit [Stutzerimonas stutzeri]
MERSPLATLLELGRQARQAESSAELQFLLVNDSHGLAPYRQAALWLDDGVRALSGVMQVEANVPYVLWLQALCRQLAQTQGTRVVARDALPDALVRDWDEWLPADVLWLSLGNAGGVLLARDLPWREGEIALLGEWAGIWHHAWQSHQAPRHRWASGRRPRPASRGRRRALYVAVALLVAALIPVRLTVLAPGELVPASPAVIRAPLEGVIDVFHVQPNEQVRQGQPLFGFDEVLIQNRLEIARQALATAEAEYRQTAQQALGDPRAKAQLAVLTGRIEEKRTEVVYGTDQLARARVLAPRDGIALFDDPSEWIGRPLGIGERIMRIAAPADVEVEAWVPLADAIPLDEGSPVALHLNASPLAPARATLRYFAHDAVERPDGSFAYRVRARLDAPTEHRVGLKGTARFSGGWVPLGYWALRRPLASLRAAIGW